LVFECEVFGAVVFEDAHVEVEFIGDDALPTHSAE